MYKHTSAKLGSVCLLAMLGAGTAQAQESAAAEEQQLRTIPVEPSTSSEGGVIPRSRGETDAGIAEIIVTAEKSAKNIQDVAASVAVVSAETLENARVQDVQDLVQVSPSVTLAAQGVNTTTLRVRGIGTQIFSGGNEQSVSVLVDGVVRAQGPRVVGDLVDIERIEVLRGPQGTLQGKNASAGVLSVVTTDPKHSFEAQTQFTVAEHGEQQLRGIVNLPFGDALALRMAGSVQDIEGYAENAVTGEKAGGSETHSLRGKLLYEPDGFYSALLSVDYTEKRAGGAVVTERATDDPNRLALIGPLAPIGPGNDVPTYDAPFYNIGRDMGGALQLDFDVFDDLTLTSITAYRRSTSFEALDADLTPLSRSPDPNPGLNELFIAQISKEADQTRTLTQELRLATPQGQDLRYVVGAFVYDSSFDGGTPKRLVEGCIGVPSQAFAPTTRAECNPPNFLLQINELGGEDRKDVLSMALFGQVDYDFTERLTGVAGLRGTREELQSKSHLSDRIVLGYGGRPLNPLEEAVLTAFYGQLFPNDTVERRLDQQVEITRQRTDYAETVDNLSGKLSLLYDIVPELTAYATVARGYKGPAFVDTDGTLTDPEISDSYEIGLKGTWFEGALFSSLAMFRSDFEGFQAQVFDPSRQSFVVTNAGDVRTQGVELDLIWNPLRGVRLAAGVSFTDAAVIDAPAPFQCYPGQEVANPSPQPIADPADIPADGRCYRTENNVIGQGQPLQNIDGGELPGAPRWKYNLGGSLGFPLPWEWAGIFAANYTWQDRTQFDIRQDPGTVHEAYGTLDVNLGFGDRAERWRIMLFGKNVLDQQYVSAIIATPTLGNTIGADGTLPPGGNYIQFVPRAHEAYYGVTLKLNFGD